MARDGWTPEAAHAVLERNAPRQVTLFRGSSFQAEKADPIPASERKNGARNIPENIPTMQPDPEGWYTLTVPGEPVPKGRVRARIAGKPPKQFVQLYTPAETTKAEERIAAAWRKAGGPQLAGRLHMEVLAYQTPQKNGKPTHEDADNLAKLAMDALNEVAYEDDRWVMKCTGEKLEDARNPRTVIRIRVVPPVPR